MTDHTNALGQPVGFPLPGWRPPPPPPREPMQGRYCRVEPLDPERHARHLHEANMRDPSGRAFTYLGAGPFATFLLAGLGVAIAVFGPRDVRGTPRRLGRP